MNPGLELRQYLRLTAMLLRSPILFARANNRIICRGLFYLAENPDLAWARELLPLAGPKAGRSLLVLIASKGTPIFSLLIADGRIKNLPGQALRAFSDLDSFCEKTGAELNLSLQAVLADFAIFEQINLKLATEPGLDAFFIAGREILAALSQGQVSFSPILPEAEMLASLDGEELLAKFGPRYGVGLENPVRLAGVVRGLGLALLSPLTRRRMRKNFEAPGD